MRLLCIKFYSIRIKVHGIVSVSPYICRNIMRNNMKRISTALWVMLCLALVAQAKGKSFRLYNGQTARVALSAEEKPVVHTAFSLLQRDLQTVMGIAVQTEAEQPHIVIGTVGQSPYLPQADFSALQGRRQAFLMQVQADGSLLIAGSDSHGTAYGIMELSRKLGVSPWEWWADVTPQRKEKLVIRGGYSDVQAPSVEYRGIFINDEDWGLMPWSSMHHEPGGEPGRVGPRTNARIFELLLRLRANTYWPAMHECTRPFFLTEGNREVAERYGIYIGGSHCEPMASSTAVEWHVRGKGEYDYVNNPDSVLVFWEDRVKEVAGQEILYTIGMRGVHDSGMKGAKTVQQQKEVLSRVFRDQRNLLARYVNPDVTEVPQVFIPYKEVLDVYNAGLEVPEDVTLMWCDDNYGYIRHFPTEAERARRGGNGIYYHVSYWGRPHDYLWLGTFSPYLLFQQMTEAYHRGIQKMWILNVGDIKPAEYQIELFMDMAWNMQEVERTGVTAHLERFLQRETDAKTGTKLLPVMQEHYRLAYIRKPEFMGNTRTEERDPVYKVVKDLPWSEAYIRSRMEAYSRLSDAVEELEAHIPENRRDAYFQLVKYPVQGAMQLNHKLLGAQLARHGKADWNLSTAAYDSIVALTDIYNNGIANGGKWNRMMDHRPRKLAVFDPVKQELLDTPMIEDVQPLYAWNGTDAQGEYTPCEGLGYEGKAVAVARGEEIHFDFRSTDADSVEVEVRLLPNHPIKGQLRFTLTLDGEESAPVSYETQGRSEEWKMNVLRNQAIRRVKLPVKRQSRHRLTFKALDEGVVVDQIMVY